MSAISEGTTVGGSPDATGEESDANGGEADDLSRDEVYELLSNHRRRFALHYLQRNEVATDVGTLAEHVAAWENEVPVAEVTSTERKRAYTSLQQFHLPKLDEKDVVDFDERAGTVELAPTAENLRVYLEVVDEHDVPWSLYYLGLALVGGALWSLTALGVAPFGSIPPAAWTVFLVVALVVSAAAHTYVTRRNRLGQGTSPPEVGR
ncbi:MAG: DUF308 domain-containing protein [Haloferacaceae archaeon]